jgi:hypothetical protein
VRPIRLVAHQGFELLNGLPFLATNKGVYALLGEHTIEEAKRLQILIVMYYGYPESIKIRYYYQYLPAQLIAEGVDPRIPWLYNFKIDFK